MSCIDKLGDRSPCIYGGLLTVGAFAAIAAIAIGVIAILANQQLACAPFGINTPAALAMCTVGSFVLGGILVLALRYCVKQKSQEDGDGEIPNSPLHPSGKGKTGAPGVTPTGTGWDIKPGLRPED